MARLYSRDTEYGYDGVHRWEEGEYILCGFADASSTGICVESTSVE